MRKHRSLTLILSILAMPSTLQPAPATTLVNIQTVCPDIVLDIRYATTNNFTKHKVYAHPSCFVQKTTAEKLRHVQEELKTKGLGLKIFDGYRPLSVQKIFWNLVPDERYVANPAKGSKHNRGTAVDVTLVDKHGKELPMPTEFDNFTQKAHRNYKNLPPEIIANRTLLEKVMHKHGFIGMPTEWWHFDDVDWQRYPILDVDFATL